LIFLPTKHTERKGMFFIGLGCLPSPYMRQFVLLNLLRNLGRTLVFLNIDLEGKSSQEEII
jgi:hypothetical protein